MKLTIVLTIGRRTWRIGPRQLERVDGIPF